MLIGLFVINDKYFNDLHHDTTIIPDIIYDDLIRFISERYPNCLPNSLIVAQAFILKYPDHGREYGLPGINKAIDDGIKSGIF